MAARGLMSFEYLPLKPRSDDTRLFFLLPAANHQDPLRGVLRHISLAGTSFEALSYVCGLPNKATDVDIEVRYRRTLTKYFSSKFGASTVVTYSRTIQGNLATALRYLRSTHETLKIWADALCINEYDADEKSQQIALMSTLYDKATRVHAWLGPACGDRIDANDEVTKALNFAEKLWRDAKGFPDARRLDSEDKWLQACTAIASTSSSGMRSEQANVEVPWLRAFGAIALATPKATPVSPYSKQNELKDAWVDLWTILRDLVVKSGKLGEFLVAMSALSQVPYFTRVWILQETGRAKADNLRFHYGHESIQYKSVFLALGLANSLMDSELIHSGLRERLDKFNVRFLSLLTARKTIQSRFSISQVLQLAYSEPEMFGAGKPEDQIHARRGLASHTQGITLNCNWSVDKVYVEATECLLRQGFMDVLLSFDPYVDMNQPSGKRIDLPSWVFDWSSKGSGEFAVYRASKGAGPKISFRRHTNSPALVMAGVSLGRIAKVGIAFSDSARDSGFGEETFRTRIPHIDPEFLSAGERERLAAHIVANYREFKVELSGKVTAMIKSHHGFPITTFWCWWMAWLSEIWEADTQRLLETLEEKVSKNVLELLFRAAPDDFRSQILKDLRVAGKLSALFNLETWSELLFGRRNAYSSQSRKLTETGTKLVDALLKSAWGMRAVGVTQHRGVRLVGCAHEAVQEGDEVVIILGANAPLIVRKVSYRYGDVYKIIGPVHISGLMHGQAMGDTSLLRRDYVIV